MKTFTRLFIFILLLIAAKPAISQDVIESNPAASKVDKDRTPGTPLLVYFVNETGMTTTSLRLKSYSASADFVWDKFNVDSKTYTNVHSEVGVSESITPGSLGAGGYRVIRSNDGTNPIDTLYAWLVMEDLKITGITPSNDCNALGLVVYHSAQIIYSYYDLSRSPEEEIIFSSNPKITWITDPEDVFDGVFDDNDRINSWKTSAIRSLTLSATEIRDPAPLVSATYTAAISNDFGNISNPVSTPEIPAIAVYAIMKAEEQDKDGNWVETTTLEGSALYKLRFDHSESRNADTYTWIAYDSYENIQTRDRVLWTYTTNSATDQAYVKYEYMGEELDGYIPGRFRDSLIVVNSLTGCRDSVDLKSILGEETSLPFIIVEPSQFNPESLPNVFTPNGDGINDVFKFVTGNEPVSMKTMNLRIFDRAGKELYHYKGRVSDWQGWNGKIKGTGSDCSVGVYYYDISGAGWDNESYSGKPYRGFVHIFKD